MLMEFINMWMWTWMWSLHFITYIIIIITAKLKRKYATDWMTPQQIGVEWNRAFELNVCCKTHLCDVTHSSFLYLIFIQLFYLNYKCYDVNANKMQTNTHTYTHALFIVLISFQRIYPLHFFHPPDDVSAYKYLNYKIDIVPLLLFWRKKREKK